MKVFIGNDHRGIKTKEKVIDILNKSNFDVFNLGTDTNESVDYPIYAKLVCKNVIKNRDSFGIVICGSGIGMSIACNKIKGIRCAKVNNPEEAFLTRNDNDSNVLALSEKTENIEKIINTFLNTPFSGKERYIKRLKMIEDLENES